MESTIHTAELNLRSGRVPANKGKKYAPEVLTPDEVRALMDECSPTASTGIRNRVLIVLMYRTGLRHSEALALLPKDVDLVAGTVRVLNGKGGRSRTVGIDPGAVSAMRPWLERRAELGFGPWEPIFCTLRGRRMAVSYMRTVLPRLARKAGIHKRVHPHGFRHTHAYELMMEEIPIGIIQRQLGHASIATTAIYLDHVAPKQVIEAITAREWKP